MNSYNIGWDFTGCIGSPKKTSIKRLFEYKLGDKAKEVWENRLSRYGQLCQEFGHQHGEDVALLDFYSFMSEIGVMKSDFKAVSKLLFEEGLIRDSVVSAMADLKQKGGRNIIVTKNMAEELEAIAETINAYHGIEVISGVVGARGKYDSNGTLVGIEELIGDYEGDLDGVSRVLKRNAVRQTIGNEPLFGYVTDTGDKDIREIAETSVIIKSSVPYAELDEYFQISADKETGNYQAKVINDAVKSVTIDDGYNLRRNLVEVLGV